MQHSQRKQLEVLQARTSSGSLQVVRAHTVQTSSSRWSSSNSSSVNTNTAGNLNAIQHFNTSSHNGTGMVSSVYLLNSIYFHCLVTFEFIYVLFRNLYFTIYCSRLDQNVFLETYTVRNISSQQIFFNRQACLDLRRYSIHWIWG